MSQRQARLIEGPVGATLARLAGPMMLGVLGMIGFNLVDSWFVGRLGSAELAALTFTFPVVFTLNGLAAGLGFGVAAVISKAIGSGDRERVRRLTTHALILALLVVGSLAILEFAFMDPLFSLMGAGPEMRALVAQYMRVWLGGAVFVVVPMVGNSALRAAGDTRTPAVIMLTAMALNFALDPLLIFGVGPFPRMELAGAALATVMARATTLVVAAWVLHAREHMLEWRLPSPAELWASWRPVLHIGLPAAGTRLVMPVGMAMLTRLVAGYGEAAVAAFGVSTRIEALALMVFMATAAALGPFIGQNWGAGLRDRVLRAIFVSQRFAVLWGLGMLALLQVVARPVGSVFSDDPEVVEIIALYLRIVPLGWGLQGVLWLSNVSLNVLRRPLMATGLSLSRMFLLWVPLALLGGALFDLPGLFAAAPVASLVAGSAAFGALRWVLGRVEF